MTNRYAHILEAIAEQGNTTGAHEALELFIAHLKRHGREKLLTKMVRELANSAARRTAGAASIEVAHQRDATDALIQAEQIGIIAKHAKVNHELLSGWRAHAGGKLIDYSGKGALIAIYQKVTT